MKIDVTIRNPLLERYSAALDSPERTALNAAMGTEVQVVTENHLRGLAATRHATADRLGASYTGFMAQAAEKVASPAALSADPSAATLTINHPGIARAFHPITITPHNATYLAIPLNALAYGRRPREFDKVVLIFKGGSRKGGAEPRKEKSDEEKAAPVDLPAFLLVRSVTQQQDRTLLPSNEEWEKAAATGARNFIAAL